MITDLLVTACTCMHIGHVQNVPEYILDNIWQFAALNLSLGAAP